MDDRPTTTERPHEQQIAEEAIQWFEAIKKGAVDGERRAELARWLKRSPRNVEHFLFATALDKTLDSIDRERTLDVDAMLAEATTGVVPLRELERQEPAASNQSVSTGVRRGNRNKRQLYWRAGLAAALALAAVALWRYSEVRAQYYTTALGEQRTFQLADGSVLQLNTGSRVYVDFSSRARNIELLDGEALFKVSRDASRPFRVRTRDSMIQVLGTQFNVYRRADGTTVSVLEGKVAVHAGDRKSTQPTTLKSTAVLGAGEEANVTRGNIDRSNRLDIANAVAWRQRRLVFRANTLSDVALEFNRYNRAPKIRLENIDGSSRHYTGTFDADDPESLASLLFQDPTLSVEHTEGEIVIRGR